MCGEGCLSNQTGCGTSKECSDKEAWGEGETVCVSLPLGGRALPSWEGKEKETCCLGG